MKTEGRKGKGGRRTLSNMHRMPRKPRPLPHQPPLLRQQLRHLPTNQLITRRLARIPIQDPLITHLPRPTHAPIVIAHTLQGRPEFRLVRIKRIPVLILLAADLPRTLTSIDLKDGVVGPVDVGVDAQAEKVLMIMCVDAGVDLRAPPLGVFAWVHGIGV